MLNSAQGHYKGLEPFVKLFKQEGAVIIHKVTDTDGRPGYYFHNYYFFFLQILLNIYIYIYLHIYYIYCICEWKFYLGRWVVCLSFALLITPGYVWLQMWVNNHTHGCVCICGWMNNYPPPGYGCICDAQITTHTPWVCVRVHMWMPK